MIPSQKQADAIAWLQLMQERPVDISFLACSDRQCGVTTALIMTIAKQTGRVLVMCPTGRLCYQWNTQYRNHMHGMTLEKSAPDQCVYLLDAQDHSKKQTVSFVNFNRMDNIRGIGEHVDTVIVDSCSTAGALGLVMGHCNAHAANGARLIIALRGEDLKHKLETVIGAHRGLVYDWHRGVPRMSANSVNESEN